VSLEGASYYVGDVGVDSPTFSCILNNLCKTLDYVLVNYVNNTGIETEDYVYVMESASIIYNPICVNCRVSISSYSYIKRNIETYSVITSVTTESYSIFVEESGFLTFEFLTFALTLQNQSVLFGFFIYCFYLFY
jgi:hypothetical protein